MHCLTVPLAVFFRLYVCSSDGKVTLQMSVPDTITSWVASAFAVSDVAGFGVAANTAKVRTALRTV